MPLDVPLQTRKQIGLAMLAGVGLVTSLPECSFLPTSLLNFVNINTFCLLQVEKSRSLHPNSTYDRATKNMSTSIDVFSGFKPAIAACQLDWDDYQIPGVTYQSGANWLAQPITCFKNNDSKSDITVNQVSRM